jgi:hypothetical protein
MAVNSTRQYRPVSTDETSQDDPLSVRALHEIADGINNYAEHVAKFPLVSQPCIPHWRSHDSTTDERVIAIFAGRVIPPSFNRLQFAVGHSLESGASGTCQWRMYISSYPYLCGDVVFDSTKLGANDSMLITTDSEAHGFSFTEGPADIVRDKDNMVYGLLTAKNSDAGTRAALTSIQVWPYRL